MENAINYIWVKLGQGPIYCYNMLNCMVGTFSKLFIDNYHHVNLSIIWLDTCYIFKYIDFNFNKSLYWLVFNILQFHNHVQIITTYLHISHYIYIKSYWRIHHSSEITKKYVHFYFDLSSRSHPCFDILLNVLSRDGLFPLEGPSLADLSAIKFTHNVDGPLPIHMSLDAIRLVIWLVCKY